MAKSSTRGVILYINGKEADASGWQTFSYGKLGEVTENIPIFALSISPKQKTNIKPPMRPITNISTSSQAELFAFSAKERDVETGLSYFGARYYSSDLSIWLSVDPMSAKYPSLSPYVYCADNPVGLVDPNGMEAAKPPLHHQFLITVGMQVYKAAKKNGVSSNGAILVLAQASLESGWGKSAMRYNDYNLFGVMGTPSKRSTTHGPVKDYSNLGGYEAAINDYFKKAKSRWPKWTAVLSQNDFTAEDIDKALNTGSYYPSKEDRQNGKYAYCGDLDENGESHYGESLIKQFSSTKKRFKDSLIYQINANEKIIQQGIPYSNEFLDRIKEENIQYKSVLDEIK